jgi:hypothetical protein
MKSIYEGWGSIIGAGAKAVGLQMAGSLPFVGMSLLSKDSPPQPQNVTVNHVYQNPDKPDPGTWGNIKTAAGSIGDQAVAHPAMALGGAAAAGLGYLALKKMRDKQAKDKQNV